MWCLIPLVVIVSRIDSSVIIVVTFGRVKMKRNLIRDEVKVQQTQKGRYTGQTSRNILKAIHELDKKDIDRVVYVSEDRGAWERAMKIMFNIYEILGYEPRCPDSNKIIINKKFGGGYDAEVLFVTAKEADADWVKYTRGKIAKAVFD
ncbi:hypothetical protein PVS_37 [Vibrio phage vB_VspS_VS-ABTNL-3]|nr:hypothetical protein PVS_37 [Vibrio phage vB_VspS_VS-ABTNL-3]